MVVAIPGVEDTEPADDGVEGRAHLVAERGEEHVLGAVGVLGLHAQELLVGEVCVAFVLEAFAVGDVADVALDDRAVVLLIHVGDHLDGVLAAVAVEQRLILIPDRAAFLESFHGGLALGLVVEHADLPKLLADEMLARVVEQPEHERVDIGDSAALLVENEDAVVSGFEKAAIADFRDFEQLLGCPAVGDVMEDHHDADDAAGFIADGCGGVVDGPLRAVFGNEHGVVCQPDDCAHADGFADRALDELARLLVDNVEHFMQGLALGLLGGPAGDPFGNGIEERAAGVGIGGDDGVADTGEGGAEPGALPVEFDLRLAPLGDVFEREENQRRLIIVAIVQPPGVEEDGPRADVGEIVSDGVVIELAVGRQNLFEQLPQRRNIPLAVA